MCTNSKLVNVFTLFDTPSVYKLLSPPTFYLCLITHLIQNISLNIQNYNSCFNFP
jgi:hypothetical protein